MAIENENTMKAVIAKRQRRGESGENLN